MPKKRFAQNPEPRRRGRPYTGGRKWKRPPSIHPRGWNGKVPWLVDAVVKIHQMHPDFCAKEIAIELGESWSSVRTAARRQHLCLKSGYERRRAVPWLQKAAVKE